MRLTFSILATLVVATARLQSAASAPGFTDQVRPILSRYCFKCHGPDDKARKSNLRFDLREGAIALPYLCGCGRDVRVRL